MDSDDIFIGLKRRDEAALSVLFDTYYEKLYLFAEKYIYDSDKAHDIVQDVFLKIWENAERLELTSSIQHYLFASVRNGCLNYLKSLQIEDRNNRKYAEAYIESQNVDMVDDEELLARVRQVLDELPEKCREVCLLRFVEGYKYAEIAARLDMNENTVKAQLHRGMERLKQAFATYDYVLVLCALGRIFMDR
ncbi:MULTISPECIES: RNA polymerase sigma factor [Butyricimonas]|jgi:RNA polymerase sigma-70 factor|uniref:RNA polymerase sigma-70 factor (ECF subfamily) n=1 Tax=Butyricimonas faecihominis TaxID=1472416 RepID=A0A7W6HVP1_9BACT|nr:MULTISPECIES: RNA polymerase sigma-70 factor [Butyricimonas]MBS6689535.1 RNA polymerase sigma-70 factor [Sanguibacteroides justesenii]KAB1506711.1 RNA polymerase sigma-70 factor [Butyricimonas faecihominis]MBB4025846.1 RNA polymerase sigma-70 factor (ECF subfamily) [Butyricimonas faecihominis]WOF07780.1 RNA polymerase sigma-70 factor [Butyricimonas faecihominis]BEI56146.1 RNA polymerase sigma-70 factor [Butyricimonas faecihominis]